MTPSSSVQATRPSNFNGLNAQQYEPCQKIRGKSLEQVPENYSLNETPFETPLMCVKRGTQEFCSRAWTSITVAATDTAEKLDEMFKIKETYNKWHKEISSLEPEQIKTIGSVVLYAIPAFFLLFAPSNFVPYCIAGAVAYVQNWNENEVYGKINELFNTYKGYPKPAQALMAIGAFAIYATLPFSLMHYIACGAGSILGMSFVPENKKRFKEDASEFPVAHPTSVNSSAQQG